MISEQDLLQEIEKLKDDLNTFKSQVSNDNVGHWSMLMDRIQNLLNIMPPPPAPSRIQHAFHSFYENFQETILIMEKLKQDMVTEQTDNLTQHQGVLAYNKNIKKS